LNICSSFFCFTSTQKILHLKRQRISKKLKMMIS